MLDLEDENEEIVRERVTERVTERERELSSTGHSNLLKLNIQRYENLLKKTNAPKITELLRMSNNQNQDQ